MRLIAITALIVVAYSVGTHGNDLLRYVEYAANDITRDARNWVASVLP